MPRTRSPAPALFKRQVGASGEGSRSCRRRAREIPEQAEDLVALGDDRALGDGEALAAGEAALGGGVVLGVAGRTLQEATLAAAFGGPTVRSLSTPPVPFENVGPF